MRTQPTQRDASRIPAPDEGTTRLTFEPGQLYHELRQAIFLVAAMFLLYRLAGPITAILLLFLLVFILAAVLNPIVTKLQSWRLPRMLGALVVVASLIAAVVGMGYMALPPLLSELSNVTGRLEDLQAWAAGYYDQLGRRFPQLAQELPPCLRVDA
jgi:predicted PurR-regulated permease PerM